MSASTPYFLGRQSLHAFTLRRLCLLLLRSMLEAALSHERFHPVYLAAKQYACCDALNWLGGLWLGERTAVVDLGDHTVGSAGGAPVVATLEGRNWLGGLGLGE